MNLAMLLEDATRRGYVAAYRLLRDPDAARDACQEAASRALASRQRYDPTRPFYPWFYRILRNHCLDRLRGARQQGTTIDVDEQAERLASAAQSAESVLATTQRQQAVLAGIERLDDDLREVIELRHFQDLSYAEMADVMECPIGTVMSRLYRARKQLRAVLLRTPECAAGRPDEYLP